MSGPGKASPPGARRMFAAVAAVAVAWFAAWSSAAQSPAARSSPAPQEVAAAFGTTVARLTVMPDAVVVPLEWEFANLWDLPMVVERLDQSCGCLAGAIEELEIAPGETGAIRAEFTPGPYRGLVRKSLHVRFVGIEQPVELVAEVTIPSTVELSARDLTWEAGDASPKVVEVEAGTKAGFRITGLVGVDAGHFKLERDVVTEGRHYRLKLTPQAGVSAGHHVLQVRTDSPDRRDQVQAVFLKVEAPSGKEGEP